MDEELSGQKCCVTRSLLHPRPPATGGKAAQTTWLVSEAHRGGPPGRGSGWCPDVSLASPKIPKMSAHISISQKGSVALCWWLYFYALEWLLLSDVHLRSTWSSNHTQMTRRFLVAGADPELRASHRGPVCSRPPIRLRNKRRGRHHHEIIILYKPINQEHASPSLRPCPALSVMPSLTKEHLITYLYSR